MKLNKTVKLIIIISSLALVFLGLSIGSAFYTVNRSKNSINSIGDIVVDADLTLTGAKSRLDKAILDYDKLDRNLGLEKKITNIDVLDEKKKEFVNSSILLANSIDQQKVKLELSNTDVAAYVSAIEEYKKAYITDEVFQELTDYSKYEVLKEKYKDYMNSESSSDSGNTSAPAEEPEIC